MTLEKAKAEWDNFSATQDELREIQDGIAFTILRLTKTYFNPLKQPEEYMEMYNFIEKMMKDGYENSRCWACPHGKNEIVARGEEEIKSYIYD